MRTGRVDVTLRRSILGALALALATASPGASSPVITTVAGNAIAGTAGDGGLAVQASINGPLDLAVDAAGNVYIATGEEDYRLRRVDAATGIITTYAGNGEEGFSLDGGLATASPVEPYAVAVDATGTVFFSDLEDHPRIRRVDATSGLLTTVAGGGTSVPGDGGPALAALIGDVRGLDVDLAGNLFFADTAPYEAVRRVDASTGYISTLAGNGGGPFCSDATPATSAKLFAPYDAAVDLAGNVFIGANVCHKVFRIDASSGAMTTVAGTGDPGSAGDGGLATAAELYAPTGVDLDAFGNLYIADQINGRVRRVDATTGIITTVAGGGANAPGDGGPPTAAALGRVSKVAVSADGATVYVADYESKRIRRIGDCGNGSIEASEQCDAGSTNGVPGSCCTANCRVWDNDGDSICDDSPDPCMNAGGARTLSKSRFAAGPDRLRVVGTLHPPTNVPFDPVVTGASITVLDGASQLVFAVTLPTGLYGGKGSRGWFRSSSGKSWKFLDTTGAPGPRMKMTVRRRTPAEMSMTIVGRNVTLGLVAGDLPITTAIVFGGQVQAAGGQCGEATFAVGSCVFATNGLKCAG